MRSEMATKCKDEMIGNETLCSGRLKVTAAHLAEAQGENEIAKHMDILAEARIGCSQACGCQHASAVFKTEKEDGKDVMYVVARCNQSPSALALGHVIKAADVRVPRSSPRPSLGSRDGRARRSAPRKSRR